MSHENPFAGQGAVMLDIGGSVGALVVEMPSGLDGVEVEVRPVGTTTPPPPHDHGAHHHPHVAVVTRPAGDQLVPSLVFPELVEGEYELYVKPDGEVRLTTEVKGGEVVYAAWPH